MIRLTKEQILFLHEELILETGGISGIRDEGMLESALNAPFQSFENISIYPSLPQKAARLGFGLIKNHPFIDGNKRIGVHAMLIFLELNGISLDYTQEELYTIVLLVASNNNSYKDLLQWITDHIRYA